MKIATAIGAAIGAGVLAWRLGHPAAGIGTITAIVLVIAFTGLLARHSD